MLSNQESDNWCLQLNLSETARKLAAQSRSSEPVRRVGGGKNNVSGKYTSLKMGKTIQFESHKVELPAIEQYEEDEDVLEYYDQPIRFSLLFKSASGRSVTFGTYELLNCCSLSGQLSRRSEDIHLPRYLGEIQADVVEFIMVIQTFQHHLPLNREPALDQRYEYLLEHTIGCVGILKTWLTKALRNALAEVSKTLILKHLEQSEYSPARRKQLREEAEAGERRLRSEAFHAKPSKIDLADNPLNNDTKPQTQKGRVGRRHPKRDPVGAN